MIGSGLKKYAKTHNMKIAHGIAYGSFYGYAASFCEGSGWKQVFASTRFPDPAQRDALRTAMAQHNLKTQYRVTAFEVVEDGILIRFLDNPGTMKKIEAFCQWFFPQLAAYGATTANICSECGMPITDNSCWKMLFGNAHHMHAYCAEKLQESLIADDTARKQEDTGSYATGLIGALIGAALGAVVWGLVLHAGYVASIVGLLIGFLAEKGYTLLKGKQDKGKVIILACATIFGVLLGNIGYDAVIWATEIAKYYPDAAVLFGESWISVSYSDIPMIIGYYFINDSEYQSAMLLNCAMGIGFALLGVWSILRKAKQETTAPKMLDLE